MLRGLQAGSSWAGVGVSPGTRAGKDLSRKRDSHTEEKASGRGYGWQCIARKIATEEELGTYGGRREPEKEE